MRPTSIPSLAAALLATLAACAPADAPTQPPPSSVSVIELLDASMSPFVPILLVGDELRVQGRARRRDLSAWFGPIAWTSSDTTVIALVPGPLGTATLHARGPGRADIEARAANVRAVQSIAVVPRPLEATVDSTLPVVIEAARLSWYDAQVVPSLAMRTRHVAPLAVTVVSVRLADDVVTASCRSRLLPSAAALPSLGISPYGDPAVAFDASARPDSATLSVILVDVESRSWRFDRRLSVDSMLPAILPTTDPVAAWACP